MSIRKSVNGWLSCRRGAEKGDGCLREETEVSSQSMLLSAPSFLQPLPVESLPDRDQWLFIGWEWQRMEVLEVPLWMSSIKGMWWSTSFGVDVMKIKLYGEMHESQKEVNSRSDAASQKTGMRGSVGKILTNFSYSPSRFQPLLVDVTECCRMFLNMPHLPNSGSWVSTVSINVSCVTIRPVLGEIRVSPKMDKFRLLNWSKMKGIGIQW